MSAREFPDMPARIARLPRDARGFPIPKFVRPADDGGEPDFRIISPAHMAACVNHDLCWICGERLGAHKVFVIGPMCCINRISSEPPNHRDCALFAVRHCPFLSIPLARRREKGLPEALQKPPGIMIKRNPGVSALWTTRDYWAERIDSGILFEIGAPDWIAFYTHGREATRAEIDASVESGYPLLEAEAERDGRIALAELARERRRFDKLLDLLVPV